MSTPPLPREQFPVLDRFRYLDHATAAAPPRVVAHVMARHASAATMLGSTTGRATRLDRFEEVRSACGALLGAAPDDLTFVRSTTDGLAQVANGLTWQEGDQVLVIDTDHPLTVSPWAALAPLGVSLTTVATTGPGWQVPLEAFEAALEGSRVRLVVVSWVHYARGWRHDLAALAALAHRHGALLVVDLIQGAGVLPVQLEAWGVDAAATGAQKWLLGPDGVGLLYTTPALRERLRPLAPGWTSITEEGTGHRIDPSADPTGRRFEGGTRNAATVGGLGAAVQLLAGAGVDRIWAHVDRWCDRLVEGLAERGATVVSDRSTGGRSAIVAATFGDTPPGAVVDRLVTHGVVAAARGGAVRFAPHGWVDDSDLEATLRAVERSWRR